MEWLRLLYFMPTVILFGAVGYHLIEGRKFIEQCEIQQMRRKQCH